MMIVCREKLLKVKCQKKSKLDKKKVLLILSSIHMANMAAGEKFILHCSGDDYSLKEGLTKRLKK